MLYFGRIYIVHKLFIITTCLFIAYIVKFRVKIIFRCHHLTPFSNNNRAQYVRIYIKHVLRISYLLLLAWIFYTIHRQNLQLCVLLIIYSIYVILTGKLFSKYCCYLEMSNFYVVGILSEEKFIRINIFCLTHYIRYWFTQWILNHPEVVKLQHKENFILNWRLHYTKKRGLNI